MFDTARPRLRLLTVAALAGSVVLLPTLSSAQAAAPADATSGPWTKASGTAVTRWNGYAGEAALAACIAPADDPLHESRMYAMTHIAIHDALNAIDRRSKPYAFSARAPHGTSVNAAVASAARSVLVPVINQIPAPFPPACLAAGVASVEADYATELTAIPEGQAKDKGIALGQAAASAILAERADDGSDTPLIVSDYPQGTAPGEYRFTPGTPFAFAPGWGEVRPFVLRDSAQYRPGPPYAVTSRSYAADLNEVKSLGGDGITTPSARTDEQTEIALFWVESSPLAWNRLARQVATANELDLWEQARLYGLLNTAMADGYIASFDTKYAAYNYWRPVTAIQNADTDGNPNTSADPTWTPLVTTPPIPDYDSAHSVEGGAAAAVLKGFFGKDRIRFELCSLTLPDGSRCGQPGAVYRSFRSFSQAAAENGESRILVGFHFRKAVDAGIEHGRKIGERAVDRVMQPR